MGVLLATRADPTLRDQLGLNGSSHGVLFGGEGATDPQIYEELVGETPDAVFARQ
jgi:diaminopropionate ammonia-lyase